MPRAAPGSTFGVDFGHRDPGSLGKSASRGGAREQIAPRARIPFMPLRHIVFALMVAAVLTAGPARAQTPPSPPPAEPLIPHGVTIARIDVGGLTGVKASDAVTTAFDRRLSFAFRSRRWKLRPKSIGAYPYVGRAVAAALTAAPGRNVPLEMHIHMGRVRRYVAYLDRIFSRPARDSELRLRNLRPFLTKAHAGIDVRRTAMTNAIVRALRRMERKTIRLQVDVLGPSVTRTSFGPIVVVRRGSRCPYLYRNTTFVRRFRIAVGMPSHPTPLGRYEVVTKQRHPTWNPPDSPWAAGLGPIPPGPGNPLGTRWIGTSAPAIGIHGTPQPWTVGTAASHGCLRMYMRDVEWLFERIRLGTPVWIVRA